MIDFYTWKTPNGQKVAIMLEELQLPYRPHFIDISAKQQFAPGYLKINPNNKIPAIIDEEGPNGRPITLFESGAILIYLAEKTGKFLSKDPEKRNLTIQWLMFQMGGVGPMFGQLNHFLNTEEKIPYAVDRYMNEAKRLLKVMDEHLQKEPYFGGEYSIADMSLFPWIEVAHERQLVNLDQYPNIFRWQKEIVVRPAVQRGLGLI